ncbi:MAG: hypothetical protein ACI976_001987 [Aureispira sp.]
MFPVKLGPKDAPVLQSLIQVFPPPEGAKATVVGVLQSSLLIQPAGGAALSTQTFIVPKVLSLLLETTIQ